MHVNESKTEDGFKREANEFDPEERWTKEYEYFQKIFWFRPLVGG